MQGYVPGPGRPDLGAKLHARRWGGHGTRAVQVRLHGGLDQRPRRRCGQCLVRGLGKTGHLAPVHPPPVPAGRPAGLPVLWEGAVSLKEGHRDPLTFVSRCHWPWGCRYSSGVPPPWPGNGVRATLGFSLGLALRVEQCLGIGSLAFYYKPHFGDSLSMCRGISPQIPDRESGHPNLRSSPSCCRFLQSRLLLSCLQTRMHEAAVTPVHSQSSGGRSAERAGAQAR